jgi:prolyl oligopeptidase
MVKEWKRGTPLASGQRGVRSAGHRHDGDRLQDFTPGHEQQFVQRVMTFYSNELYLRSGAKLQKIDKPDDADAYTVRDQLVIQLRSDWTVGGATYPRGALLATSLADFLKGGAQLRQVLFAPSPRPRWPTSP